MFLSPVLPYHPEKTLPAEGSYKKYMHDMLDRRLSFTIKYGESSIFLNCAGVYEQKILENNKRLCRLKLWQSLFQ